ncbi:MAG: ABC transporter permease [Candidatus Bathyarchaeota archaeon]
MAFSMREAIGEFWASRISKLGVAFLIGLFTISLYVLVSYPLNFGTRYWNSPQYWADYPKSVPPAWTQSFSSVNKPMHQILISDFGQESYRGIKTIEFNLRFDFKGDIFPQFTSFSLSELTFWDDPPIIYVTLIRPDGTEIEDLLRVSVPFPPQGAEPPHVKYVASPLRIFLPGSTEVHSSISRFLRTEYDLRITPAEVGNTELEKFMFSTPDAEGNFIEPLKGSYIVKVLVEAFDEDDEVDSVKFVVGGEVFGFMGTDVLGRDLAVGLLFGFPVALFIGFLTSTLTTMVGSVLGIMSGYMGGKIDTLIQRISDILNNLPQLPILIFLVFILGQNIWNIILVLVFFGWAGLTILVRSMVLQSKEEQFIEASVAVGASNKWIMARHIFPQVAPFIFTQMIFYTPSAILAEAALSFLGLGDPTLPTWGQILERGFQTGAIFLGYWWWIVPPGLLIVITALCFVFIAQGLEPVVNPRLRRRR